MILDDFVEAPTLGYNDPELTALRQELSGIATGPDMIGLLFEPFRRERLEAQIRAFPKKVNFH